MNSRSVLQIHNDFIIFFSFIKRVVYLERFGALRIFTLVQIIFARSKSLIFVFENLFLSPRLNYER